MKRETIIKRRNELLKDQKKGSITVLFSGDLVKRSADSSYPFVVNRNFYYLTNCDEDSLIYVYINTENVSKEMLFIKDYNPLEEKWVGKSLTKDEVIHFLNLKVSLLEHWLVMMWIPSMWIVNVIALNNVRMKLKHLRND